MGWGMGVRGDGGFGGVIWVLPPSFDKLRMNAPVGMNAPAGMNTSAGMNASALRVLGIRMNMVAPWGWG